MRLTFPMLVLCGALSLACGRSVLDDAALDASGAAALVDTGALPADASVAPRDAAAPDAAPPGVTICGGYTIAASAPIGCRAPREPGCGTCCRTDGDGGCNSLSGNTSPESHHEYNGLEHSDEPCPSSCNPCAPCLEQDEESLCALLVDPRHTTCDCTKPVGIDPCFTPASCECYCANLAGALYACPAP